MKWQMWWRVHQWFSQETIFSGLVDQNSYSYWSTLFSFRSTYIHNSQFFNSICCHCVLIISFTFGFTECVSTSVFLMELGKHFHPKTLDLLNGFGIEMDNFQQVSFFLFNRINSASIVASMNALKTL